MNKLFGSRVFTVVASLLVLLSTCTRTTYAQPQLYGDCSSSELQNGYSVVLRNDLVMHWKRDSATTTFLLDYDGESWISLGFAATGNMIDADAVIGLPSYASAGLYKLMEKQVAGVKGSSDNRISGLGGQLLQASVAQSGDGSTKLQFMASSGDNSGWTTILFAIGTSNDFAYHQHRSAFQINLDMCGPPVVEQETTDPILLPSESNDNDSSSSSGVLQKFGHSAAFAVHGFFAIAAFAIVLPFGMVSAWFRSIFLPESWVYIHVASQLMALLLGSLSVLAAVIGVRLRCSDNGCISDDGNNNGHMSHSHHRLGVAILIIFLFQLINGALRPSRADKTQDPSSKCAEHEPEEVEEVKTNSYTYIIKFTSTKSKRELWSLIHGNVTACVLLLCIIIQISGGLLLFGREYEGGSKVKAILFWIYIILLALLLGGFIRWYNRPRGLSDQDVKSSYNVDDNNNNSANITIESNVDSRDDLYCTDKV